MGSDSPAGELNDDQTMVFCLEERSRDPTGETPVPEETRSKTKDPCRQTACGIFSLDSGGAGR
jgi:hypothetical protein